MNIDRKELGRAIKAARTKAKLTQEEVAERIDLSLASIKHIESGRRYPSISSLVKIAHTLGTTADRLLYAVDMDDDATKQAIICRLSLCTPSMLK